jgi:serine/threonine protein kinase
VRAQEATIRARDAELKAMASKASSLSRALDSRTQPPSDSSARPAEKGSQLVPDGVQLIPAAELDLDLDPASERLLGTGTYSEVYRTTRTVAVKALRGRFSQQRFREFTQEAELLQHVQGSAVCALSHAWIELAHLAWR